MSLSGRFSAGVNCHNSLDLNEEYLDHLRCISFYRGKSQSMVINQLNWSNNYFVICKESECLIENRKVISIMKYSSFPHGVTNICRHCQHSRSCYQSLIAMGQLLLLPLGSHWDPRDKGNHLSLLKTWLGSIK